MPLRERPLATPYPKVRDQMKKGILRKLVRGMILNAGIPRIRVILLEISNREEFQRRYQYADQVEADAAWRSYQSSAQTQNELVIGRLDDTAAGSELGMTRLNDPDWSLNVNDAWVQGGIDAKKNFYLGSSETPLNLWDYKNNRPTVMAREIQQIRNAGYIKQGDYYIHPDNIISK